MKLNNSWFPIFVFSGRTDDRTGSVRPSNPPASLVVPKALEPSFAQARSDRTEREHEARPARNMMSNHTAMQDKYCEHSPYSKSGTRD